MFYSFHMFKERIPSAMLIFEGPSIYESLTKFLGQPVFLVAKTSLKLKCSCLCSLYNYYVLKATQNMSPLPANILNFEDHRIFMIIDSPLQRLSRHFLWLFCVVVNSLRKGVLLSSHCACAASSARDQIRSSSNTASAK